MVRIEGVDYSTTPNANWSTIAAGFQTAEKHFVGRYAVADKSPSGRGITEAEYLAMTAAGIEVFLYYEENEAWMRGGFEAGKRAGTRALQQIRDAGMPEKMPVYYSHDIEPNPADYAAVDDCLRGAASVVGADAVGLYGGFNIIEHCAGAGTAKWFCQTWAWSGDGDAWDRNISDKAHLYQYETRTKIVAGVSVDLVAALQDQYGQASSFLPPTIAERIPVPLPEGAKNGDGFSVSGRFYMIVAPRRLRLKRDANQYAVPDGKTLASTTKLLKPKTVTVPYVVSGDDGDLYRVSVNGTYIRATNFVERPD